MKLHTPLFIIGLIIFALPLMGIPTFWKNLVISVLGIAVMILVTHLNNSEITEEELLDEILEEVTEEPTYEEIVEEVQEDEEEELENEEDTEELVEDNQEETDGEEEEKE